MSRMPSGTTQQTPRVSTPKPAPHPELFAATMAAYIKALVVICFWGAVGCAVLGALVVAVCAIYQVAQLAFKALGGM